MKPFLTPADIESVIEGEQYHLNDQMTICTLILKNGAKVGGINYGSIDPSRHSEQIGREEARKEAVEKVWELEGYLLRQRLMEAGQSLKSPFQSEVNRSGVVPILRDGGSDHLLLTVPGLVKKVQTYEGEVSTAPYRSGIRIDVTGISRFDQDAVPIELPPEIGILNIYVTLDNDQIFTVPVYEKLKFVSGQSSGIEFADYSGIKRLFMSGRMPEDNSEWGEYRPVQVDFVVELDRIHGTIGLYQRACAFVEPDMKEMKVSISGYDLMRY